MSRMKIDLSGKKNTLANKVNTELLPILYSMTKEEIKEKFLSYLKDESLTISDETRRKYTYQIEKQKNVINIQSYIYNLALKTNGMGTF